MIKSTITRERLEVLANAEYCKSNPGAWLLGLKEVNELARMALAFYEWHDKTAWVQTDKRFDVLTPWGKHRADVLKEYIEYLENRVTQPVPVVPEALERLRSIVADSKRLPRRKEWIGGQQYSYVLLEEVEAIIDDACRSAMLTTTPQETDHVRK